MTLKERAAMQQALEALELFGTDDMAYIKSDKAITALREALAEQAEQEPVAWGYFDSLGAFIDALNRQHGAYQTPLYAAPVQKAEQEPVGRWNWNEAKFEWLTKFDYHKHHMTPLYAAPQPLKQEHDDLDWITPEAVFEAKLKLHGIPNPPVQPVKQEPVGVVNTRGGINWRLGQKPLPPRTHLYAAPVQQVDLTDDEIGELIMPVKPIMEFARAVIAAYQEKNK